MMKSMNTKILKVLTKKGDLNLEVADIAFQLNLDQEKVAETLRSLFTSGQVTRKQDDRGRIFWYTAQSDQHNSTSDSATTGKISQEKTIEILIMLIVLVVTVSAAFIVANIIADSKIKKLTDLTAIFENKAVTKINSMDREIRRHAAVIDSLQQTIDKLNASDHHIEPPKPIASKPAKKNTKSKKRTVR